MPNFIYKPKGKAAEYGDYALNIYTGCPHNCYFCFGPGVLRREKDVFHNTVVPRDGIVDGVKEQLKQNGMKNKLIHLCFVCDPYPKGHDSSITREIIKVIKESGNHVQILTKNGEDSIRDFDLLDDNDWFGISYSGYQLFEYYNGAVAEPGASSPKARVKALEYAKSIGINTWVSCEPVLNDEDVLDFIYDTNFVDLWKVGKLNYHPSDINWKNFGIKVEKLLKEKELKTGCKYYIKESLRKEMETNHDN
jgi:DNA repair photolyase